MNRLNEQINRAKELMGILKEQTKANSSRDSEGNEVFTWDDRVIFKSATFEPNTWFIVHDHKEMGRNTKVSPAGIGILKCMDCDDRKKSDIGYYRIVDAPQTPYASYEKAYEALGKKINMDLSEYVPG